MFQEPTAESKSDTDRLRQSSSEAASSTMAPGSANTSSLATKAHHNHSHQHHGDEMQNKTSYSVSKQQMAATALHQHYLNYFNSNIPKEETKSQRMRGSIFKSQDHPPQMSHPIANQRTNHSTTNRSCSSKQTHVYHIPSQQAYNPGSHQQNYLSHMSRSAPRDESPMTQMFQPQQSHHQQQQPPQSTQIKPRNHSTGALYPISQQQSQQMALKAHNNRLEQQKQLHQQQPVQVQQQDKDSEEAATTIKMELENDLQDYKTSELEAISSLERNLPIELSFLIRQQAHCMARMNYLDRQIRELKDITANQSQQQVESNQVSSTSILNQSQLHRPASNIVNAATTIPHTKNGQFILSDDSGGEYSRATISDDDELSSLLDQIAKSVRPERACGSSNSMTSNNYGHQQQQQRLASGCATLISSQQQPQQSYAIINPNQLHHQQAVPIFVMGSPIAVAHPSSINSNILPGVHFQPEPRYNQYYEDFYHDNPGIASSLATTPTSAMQRFASGHSQQHHFNHRAQQFDNSISVIEQLVSQKEKRQIMSQLKSADNWLKMRSSNQDSSLKAASVMTTIKQHQRPSITRQLSNESGAQEADVQQGDNKEASTSGLQTGVGKREIVDQVDE